jgi:hypothetical protein
MQDSMLARELRSLPVKVVVALWLGLLLFLLLGCAPLPL